MPNTLTKKYKLNGSTVIDYLNIQGTLLERDYLNLSGKVIQRDYYTSGVLNSKVYFSNSGKVTEKDFYKNGLVSEKDYFTSNSLTGKVFYNSLGAVTEKDIYKSGKVTEKDFYKNGLVSEKDYFTSNSLTGKVFYNSLGAVTEKDIYKSGKVTEKDFYKNGLVSEKDYFTSNSLTGKVFYNSLGAVTEKDTYKSGKVTEKDFYSASQKINEKDFYSSGVLNSKYFYNTSAKLTEISYWDSSTGLLKENDFYSSAGKITEKDLYKSGVLSSKAFYNASNKITEQDNFGSNGVVTEKDLYANGVIGEKDYYNASGKLSQINYYDNSGKYISTGVIITNSTGDKVISFGESSSWKNYLDYAQGDNSKGYLLSCGLISCENVLIEMGVLPEKSNYSPSLSKVDSTESIVVDYAAANGLCYTASTPENDGLTYGVWQQQVLAHFGVAASDVYITVDAIANAVKNNQCVIAEVDAYRLWGTGYSATANHAITITGVDYALSNPSVVQGFYICDSGRWEKSDASRYVSYSLLESIFELTNNNSLGEAIITASSGKEILSSTIPSTVATSLTGSVDVASVVQSMTAYATNLGNIATSALDSAQYSNIANLVPVKTL